MKLASSLVLGTLAVLPAAAAFAQAEGDFPASILCDPSPLASGPARDTLRVARAGGRASYSRRLPGGGTETGSGVLAGRSLTLTGSGRGPGFNYTARYAGEASGRGGLLTGRQSWTRGARTGERACQLTLGDGRG